MTKHLPTTSRSLPISLIRAREGVMAPIREMLAAIDLESEAEQLRADLKEATGELKPKKSSSA